MEEDLVFFYLSLSAVLLIFPKNLFHIYSSFNSDQERWMIMLAVKKKKEYSLCLEKHFPTGFPPEDLDRVFIYSSALSLKQAVCVIVIFCFEIISDFPFWENKPFGILIFSL